MVAVVAVVAVVVVFLSASRRRLHSFSPCVCVWVSAGFLMVFNGFQWVLDWLPLGWSRSSFVFGFYFFITDRPSASGALPALNWSGEFGSFFLFFSFHANKTTNFTSISVVGKKQSETPLRRRKISVSTVIWPSLFEDCVEMDSRDLKKTRHFCDCNGIFFYSFLFFFSSRLSFLYFVFCCFLLFFFWMRGRPFPCRGPTPSFTGVRWRPAL